MDTVSPSAPTPTPRTPDPIAALGHAPLLARAAMDLWDALDSSARLEARTGTASESFSGVEMDLSAPTCPCLLITVPGRPNLYVELFLDDEGMEDGPRLVALVNWVGSEGDPAVFDADPSQPAALVNEVVGSVRELIGQA